MSYKDQNVMKGGKKMKFRVYSIVGCEFGAPTVNRDDRAESDCILAP